MAFFDFVEKVIRKTGNKIRKIQRSDNETKKKWVIKSSVITVSFVVILWIIFLGSSIPKTTVEVPQIDESQESSFLSTFSKGLVVVGGDIRSFAVKTFSGAENIWDSIKGNFIKSRDFSFEGEDVRDIFRGGNEDIE